MIKKRKVILISSIVSIVASLLVYFFLTLNVPSSSTFNTEIESHGWTVSRILSEKDLFDPIALKYNLHFLKIDTNTYQKIYQQKYLLKETCSGFSLSASILTSESEEVLGSYIIIDEHDPGTVPMVDKEIFLQKYCQSSKSDK